DGDLDGLGHRLAGELAVVGHAVIEDVPLIAHLHDTAVVVAVLIAQGAVGQQFAAVVDDHTAVGPGAQRIFAVGVDQTGTVVIVDDAGIGALIGLLAVDKYVHVVHLADGSALIVLEHALLIAVGDGVLGQRTLFDGAHIRIELSLIQRLVAPIGVDTP